MSAPSHELLTSFRYDPRLRSAPWNMWRGNPPSPFFLLPFHLERLVSGAREFGWMRALDALGVDPGKSVDVGEGIVVEDAYVYADALERFRTLCQGSVDAHFAEHSEGSGGGDGGGDSEQALKIRVTLSKDGILHATASPTPLRPYDLLAASTFDPATLTAARDTAALLPFASPPVRVLLDTQPTPAPYSPLAGVKLTPHKTTARGAYDAARARAGIPPLTSAPAVPARPTEVLLHTPGAPGRITDASIRTPFFYRAGRWVTPALPRPCAPPSHNTAATTPQAGTRAHAPSPVLVPLAGTVRRFLLAHGSAVEGEVPLGEVEVGEWVLLCNAVEGCVMGVLEGGGMTGE